MERTRVMARTVLLLALALTMTLAGRGEASTQRMNAVDWDLTPLHEPVIELLTAAGSTLYARTTSGLFRTDDFGTSWTPVGLPAVEADPRAWQVEVDPTDPGTLYVAGVGGLSKSTDGGASWALLLPTDRHAARIAVSPADPGLVYLGLITTPGISSDFWFLRSRDGGATWEQLEEHHNSLCGWGVPILLPHPTDPRRVFRAADCLAGRNFSETLVHSADQGVTWTTVFGTTRLDASEPQLAYPARLVGGRGTAPARYYLAANRDARFGGSSVFRGDDDGRTWVEVLAFRGGGTMDQPEAPISRLDGLAYDPATPDRVFAVVNVFGGGPTPRGLVDSFVTMSSDGGADWTDLGGGNPGMVNDVELSVDGRYLYIATDRGVSRLALDGISPQRPPVQVPSRAR